ncbi:hypothetical protein [Eubacterium sp.]
MVRGAVALYVRLRGQEKVTFSLEVQENGAECRLWGQGVKVV